MLKLDLFNHIYPEPFFRLMMRVAPQLKDLGKRMRAIPMLVDLDMRFRVMDQFGDYRQVLSLASPAIEAMGDKATAVELARVGNDGMADLVARYPARFPAFAASLPMSDPEAALAELHRAIGQLGARAVQLYTNALGKPLDAPEFLPLFDAMAGYDLPILLHPIRGAEFPDYLTEKRSLYEIWWTFGWPYETSVAMARLVFSKLFLRHPNLKVVAHHMGAMVPYFAGRVGPGWDQLGKRTTDEDYAVLLEQLGRRPIDFFKMFHADTAVFGAESATLCGLDFYGVDHVVFASDSPFDPEGGAMYIRETIRILDRLAITEEQRAQIYHGNTKRLLKLD